MDVIITVTTPDGVVIDSFSIEEEIGNLEKKMAQAELVDRVRAAQTKAAKEPRR